MNADLAIFEALAKDILRRCLADDDPEELRKWIAETLVRLGATETDALMTWEESFALVEKIIEQYEIEANTPIEKRQNLRWPWASWNNLIDPLEDGMLAVIAAPDGAGKTLYSESIAEHWAAHRNKVVFVHYELNRKLMMLRRTSRHTGITSRELKSGHLTRDQKELIANAEPRLLAWDGCISYLHTPGWSMEKTITELIKLHAEERCDVVVLDYLEKAAASDRQLKLFAANVYQREADNVEQLKNFAEKSGVPVLMVAQMSKAGKSQKFESMDRGDMRGAGEKSDKANLVILLNRQRTDDGYSNDVEGLVDKNTMGACGTFVQTMQPEYYRVTDKYHAGGLPTPTREPILGRRNEVD